MLADSFRGKDLASIAKYGLLRLLLNCSAIEFVANHSLAASLDLKRIGVDPRKIVPFDWPALLSPCDYNPKDAPPPGRSFRLLYVGSLIESKGVGDAILAVSKLRQRRKDVQLTLIGGGDLQAFEEVAENEGIRGDVSFLGLRSHSDVLSAMREHDAILVPSRWSYPEGLPMTLYEALCTRTPLITSDHPMFALKICNLSNALVFPERNIEAFAGCIDKLMSSPVLYAQLSCEAGNSANDFLCPLKYDQLISCFLHLEERSKLSEYSLDTYGY
jgi:glycosyltransferase involved in cell wall biosynthesis